MYILRRDIGMIIRCISPNLLGKLIDAKSSRGALLLEHSHVAAERPHTRMRSDVIFKGGEIEVITVPSEIPIRQHQKPSPRGNQGGTSGGEIWCDGIILVELRIDRLLRGPKFLYICFNKYAKQKRVERIEFKKQILFIKKHHPNLPASPLLHSRPYPPPLTCKKTGSP